MKIYYHAVGVENAERDFPQTVFKKIPISVVQNNIPTDFPGYFEIISTLSKLFPSGEFNCWGVPVGAPIASLAKGDVVFLATEAQRNRGHMPAMGVVKAYWHHMFPQLSNALWGEPGFPYIFYFNTEEIDLNWVDFKELLGYKPGYFIRNHFMAVADDILPNPSLFVQQIREEFGIHKGLREIAQHYDLLTQEEVYNTVNSIEDIKKHEQEFVKLPITEREAIIKSRLGQGKFRSLLIEYWDGCAVTGNPLISILRASHIKPWKDSSNEERLDLYNGLLLSPNLDALFDLGYISFTITGNIILSSQIDYKTLLNLGINSAMRLIKYDINHTKYLEYHRQNVFRE